MRAGVRWIDWALASTRLTVAGPSSNWPRRAWKRCRLGLSISISRNELQIVSTQYDRAWRESTSAVDQLRRAGGGGMATIVRWAWSGPGAAWCAGLRPVRRAVGGERRRSPPSPLGLGAGAAAPSRPAIE